ncbi:hypothetical protein GOBAR_AA32771 [Gossypium barbadense]|uniref:Uncharacterized protein n=1 Tax=Gossypium barbadense TaxID=3634 RepID=A0A2P5WA02_GOSBA|nr:hypothetical protein GOBAR_AA32771 [Gossypium barbadense]
MDSATVQDVIYSLFESTPSLKDSAKIIDKLNQFMQFDSPLGEGKGRRVEELLKRCPNLKKIIIFRVISKAKPHKECQVLCHVVPSLVKLRKEGLDGHEKIKSYVKHVMVTAFLLVCGAMTMTWICDTISESGFGQGSSLIICVGILTGYTDTLYKMLTQLSGSAVGWWPYMLAVLGVFTVVTMWAVVITEGCRKIKLQYYGFKLASAARWWISLGFAIVEAVIVACYSLQYSIYAASYKYFGNVNMKVTNFDAKKFV